MVTMQYSTPFLKSIYRREQLLRLYNQIRLLFQTVLTINKTYCSTFSTHYNRFSTCRSEEHTSELQSRFDLVCRLLLEKKKQQNQHTTHKNDKRVNDARTYTPLG